MKSGRTAREASVIKFSRWPESSLLSAALILPTLIVTPDTSQILQTPRGRPHLREIGLVELPSVESLRPVKGESLPNTAPLNTRSMYVPRPSLLT